MKLTPKMPSGLIALVGMLLLMAAPAFADDAPKLDSGDTAWMMTATALVLMMTIPGVALFYGGMVRKMNVLTMMTQSFAICCLVSVLWMVAGYSLAFTDGNAIIGGFDRFLLKGLTLDSVSSLAKTIPETVYITYQMTFAIITEALITGAFADRMKFSAMLLFSGVWLLLVYVPVAKWVWGGGFLGSAGVLDYAGGTVVHINAGIAGLVTCLMIGKRKGYGTEIMAPHIMTLSVIGAAMLWVGWFGFNAGSAVSAGTSAGMAMLVTQIATAMAAMAWMIAEWMTRGKPSVLGIISGAVAGLVAITPACGFVSPGSALIIGLVASLVAFWASTSLKNALGYDDSLDVFGVHGVAGIVGAILTGVFAVGAIGGAVDPTDAAAGMKSGLIDGNPKQVLSQLYGVGVTIVYTAIATAIIFKVVDLIIGCRVEQEVERDGLDLNQHGETVH